MNSIYIWVMIFAAIALVALFGVWVYARRVKRELDDISPAVAGVRATFELSPGRADGLRGLSAEPILIKQGEEGVRVQIEHRPMLPLMAFVGQDVSTALTEAAARISEKWGPRWVVLLSTGVDGSVTAQRLS
jgi:hypothetical protein